MQPVAYYTVSALAFRIYVAVPLINTWAYISTIFINMETELNTLILVINQHNAQIFVSQ